MQPPFVAPPTDRDNRRLWITIALSALLLLVCCGGGIAGVVTVVYTTYQDLEREARRTVTTYLTALRDQDWGAAYAELCQPARERETAAEFAGRVSARPKVTAFTLGQTVINNDEVEQNATVTRDSGPQQVRFTLVQEDASLDLKICSSSD